MSKFVDFLDRKFYPGVEGGWDIHGFAKLVDSRLEPEYAVLDFGAGRGRLECMDFRDRCRRVAGVDVDPVVQENPRLHEARMISLDDEKIPFEDEAFDVVYSLNVLEHLPNPEQSFQEICRVLRPGGLFLAKTPNRFHYVPIIASLTPQWFHVYITKLRGRKECDTFPTCYKCNSPRAIRKLAAKTGFEVTQLKIIESRPEYLRILGLTYLAGIAFERLVNSLHFFEPIRCVLQMELRKK